MEERGIPYTWQFVDMEAGEHRQDPYLAINPFGKVPALVDEDPSLPGGRVELFESGAILLYLAERFGANAKPPRSEGLLSSGSSSRTRPWPPRCLFPPTANGNSPG